MARAGSVPDRQRTPHPHPHAARRRLTLAIVVAALLGYVAADVLWPLHRDFTRFDATAVGTLETRMWRAYYERRQLALFLELAQALRTQYHLPFFRSYVGAYHAASAAFIFKDGKVRSDYEKALPALRAHFRILRNTDSIAFDAERAATLELEWWIVHRDHERYPDGALGQACAVAAGALYQVPAGRVLPFGQLRAQAMLLRDARAEAGGVSEPEWATIEGLLHRGYGALRAALSAGPDG